LIRTFLNFFLNKELKDERDSIKPLVEKRKE